jgi:hypothetical protein
MKSWKAIAAAVCIAVSCLPAFGGKPEIYTCTYPRHPDDPHFRLTTDGKYSFANDPFKAAASFKRADDGSLAFLIVRPDGKHVLGFDLRSGEGSDSIQQPDGTNMFSRISCKK